MKSERRNKGYSIEDISILYDKSTNACMLREENGDEEYAAFIKSLPPRHILLMRARVDRGMSIEEVATLCGKKPSTIERWERGASPDRGMRKWFSLFYSREKKRETNHAAAICWTCKKVGLRECSWDARLELVEGSEHIVVCGGLKVITKCPLYEKDDYKNSKKNNRGNRDCN